MKSEAKKRTFEAELFSRYQPGDVFSSSDFKQTRPSTVRSAFSRLVRKEQLMRLSGGYYAIPRKSRVSGRNLFPEPEKVALAVGRKVNSRVMPSGAILANKYQLCEQVPAQAEYLVNARSFQIRVGNSKVRFLSSREEILKLSGTIIGEIAVALLYMGEPKADKKSISRRLSLALTETAKRQLKRQATESNIPAWIRSIVLEVA